MEVDELISELQSKIQTQLNLCMCREITPEQCSDNIEQIFKDHNCTCTQVDIDFPTLSVNNQPEATITIVGENYGVVQETQAQEIQGHGGSGIFNEDADGFVEKE